ncbi:hypothetical protein NPS33_26605, partial [Pseudomonas putida]
RLGAGLDIASYKHGGRARLSQASLARNKRRSERSSRCAARAALDLPGAKQVLASPWVALLDRLERSAFGRCYTVNR